MSINPTDDLTGNFPALRREIHEVNAANGWYEVESTYGDHLALLHSEVSEAFEAFRDHGFEDATAPVCRTVPRPKPEGVGSELADVLIRLLDMVERGHIFPWWMNLDLARIGAPAAIFDGMTFGEIIADLHFAIAGRNLAGLLPRLVAAAEVAGVDLLAETHRKIAYNRTRGYRHGGKRV